ncbi:MAG: zinc-binding dehydrogenase, partial [Cyanothece sp. SIO1E1]|nr:zinc-binding dehydrogenase [Cyanothece sp. SIO1E1]
RLVVDAVGGETFSHLVRATVKGGTLVSYGVSGGVSGQTNILSDLFGNGGQRKIYGLTLYTEVERQTSAQGLRRLMHLIEAGQLEVPAIKQADWAETPRLAASFLNREFSGKAVLTIS